MPSLARWSFTRINTRFAADLHAAEQVDRYQSPPYRATQEESAAVVATSEAIADTCTLAHFDCDARHLLLMDANDAGVDGAFYQRFGAFSLLLVERPFPRRCNRDAPLQESSTARSWLQRLSRWLLDCVHATAVHTDITVVSTLRTATLGAGGPSAAALLR